MGSISNVLNKNKKYNEYFSSELSNKNDDVCITYTNIICRIFDHLTSDVSMTITNLKLAKQKKLPPYTNEIPYWLKNDLSDKFWSKAKAYKLLLLDMIDDNLFPTDEYDENNRYILIKFYADLENKIIHIENSIPDDIIKSLDVVEKTFYSSIKDKQEKYGDFEILLDFFENPLYWIDWINYGYEKLKDVYDKTGEQKFIEKDASIKLWESITQLKCNYNQYDQNIMEKYKFWKYYFDMKDIKTNHIGETNTTTNGQIITIIAYRNYDDLDVRFEDGTIIKHRSYKNFKKGIIKNPNKRIGETSVASNGQQMVIIGYRNSSDLDVRFNDGTIVKNRSYACFKRGHISNPNYRKET